MNRLRATSAVLISLCLTTLTACGGDTTPTAGPAATTPAASTPAAPSASAPAGGTAGTNDRELCETANKAGKAMMADMLAAMKAGNGEPSPDAMKKVLDGLNQKLATAAAEGDSQVAAAMKQVAAKASEVAGAANPMEAADNPEFVKAGEDLTAACKAAGVKVNF